MLIEPPDEYTLTEIVQTADLPALDRGLTWAEAALDAARKGADAEVTRVLQDIRCGRSPTRSMHDASLFVMGWRECKSFLHGVRVGRATP